MKKKCLFIDRDGTLVKEPDDEQVDAFEKVQFLPGVFTHLGQICRQFDFELVMVTNQDGLGTDSFPEDNFWPVHNFILDTLAGEGIQFKQILIDRSFPGDNLETRKPGLGMLGDYVNSPEYDLEASYVIGDRESDMQLAVNLGCTGLGLGENFKSAVAVSLKSWDEIAKFLHEKNRCSQVCRKTKETDIQIDLSLDGTGNSQIVTGLGFFDHMLDQISRHGEIQLGISVNGDLQVDEHHTVEDTGLALGEAFRKALGDKRGISRYGFDLPMDDADARVLIDFGGRPWFKWEAVFKREKVGDLPTELFSHFFKSFSDTAQCNLHIRASGENEHHKIEAIFKAFARAVRMAKSFQGGDRIPSTKEVI